MSVIKRGQVQIIERYRPRKFSEVIGCDSVKSSLEKWMNQGDSRSKVLLLKGSSGCGKSTLSRILAMGLNCENGDTTQPCLECSSCKSALSNRAMHIHDLNIGSLGTKEEMQKIVEQMYESSLTGRNSVWILDECQMLTQSSQNLLLKPMENPPPHTYLILCTTNPQKLIKTLQNRCQKYDFKNPKKDEISKLLSAVVKQQGVEIDNEKKKVLFDYVQGMSYRQILNTFNQFVNGGIECLTEIGEDNQTINYWKLCQTVFRGDFDQFLKIIDGNDNLDCQAFRRMMRSFLINKIKNGGLSNQSKMCSDIFALYDNGFFVDPNPLPTVINMVFRTCFHINSMKK